MNWQVSTPTNVITPLFSDTSRSSVIAGGGTYATGILAVPPQFNSYDILIEAYCTDQALFTPGSPLTLYTEVDFYADAAATIPIGAPEIWETWVADDVTTIKGVRGTSPVRGPYMVVSLVNFGTAAIEINRFIINADPRTVTLPVWVQDVPHMTSTAAWHLITPSNNSTSVSSGERILASMIGVSASVSTQYWFPMPLGPGRFHARFQTSPALAKNFVLCQASELTNTAMNTGTAAPGVLWNPGNTAGTEYAADLISGRAPMLGAFATGTTGPSLSLVVMSEGAVS